MKLKADIDPAVITAIIDTREQLPLDLSPLRVEVGTLATGDYSVKGLEDFVCIERKSLSDLLGCMGTGRDRFERELHRMQSYPYRNVICEFAREELSQGQWTSKISPKAAEGSVAAWEMHVGFVFCPGYWVDEATFVNAHEAAGKEVARKLFMAARHRWRESRALVGGVVELVNETEGKHETGT